MSTYFGRGQEVIPLLLDRSVLAAAASYSPPAIAGGAFRKLKFKVRLDSGTATGVGITLTSLTNTYKFASLYQTQPAAAPAGIAAAAWAWGFTATPMIIKGEIDIESGGIRMLNASQLAPDGLGAGAPIFYAPIIGQNTDTVNQVTGLVIAFTGGTGTGMGELEGIP